VGNGIYFYHEVQGTPIGSSFPTTTTAPDEVYLRLVRDGEVYTGYVSEDGVDWTMLGQHTVSAGFMPAKIGLFAASGTQQAAEIPSDFDFFCVNDESITTATPTVTSTSTATPTATATTPTSTPTATPTGLPCSDAYEPDDEWFQARSILMGGSAQEHSFYPAGDVDFVKFPTLAGETYIMRTFNLGGRPDNDTTLTLYDVDGTTQLAYNDDHPLEELGASRIVWEALDTGMHFLKVAQFNPNVGGCELTYLLEVTHGTPMPTVTPTATVTPPANLIYLPLVLKN